MGKLTFCRMCKRSNLVKYLDLGLTPPADKFLTEETINEPEIHYPLDVLVCTDCGQSQLGYIVPPEILYADDYIYEMSITKMGQEHWAEFARTVSTKLELNPNDLVIDIGSNVGVLLEEFRKNKARILGVDPASTIAKIANDKGVETICNIFSIDLAHKILEKYGYASVITGTNVFAHINDLDELMKGVNILLKEGGVFIFESPYLVNLINNLEYDTIYHEHLSYLSVKPLVNFFRMFGMEIFNIEEKDIHGGSFRVYINRIGNRPVLPIVNKMIKKEDEIELYSLDNLKKFASEVEKNRKELVSLLFSLRAKGKKIAAVGAPAKGMTLLNYCHIDKNLLDFATEKSKLKIGRYTPGMHFSLVSDDELIKQHVDYALLLAWNFADEIIDNLKEYRAQGGKFIIPIPKPKII